MAAQPATARSGTESEPPICPRCRSSMILRTRRADDAAFWGCSHFPTCRGTRALETAVDGTAPTPPITAMTTAIESPRAGGSTRATYERRLAAHEARIRRRRPDILAVGGVMILAGIALVPQGSTLPLLGVALIFAGLAWTLAELYAKPPDVLAWRIGAAGEEQIGRTLAMLEADGFHVFHDRRRPGGRDNIDHIVVGPPGVIVIETKHYAGDVRVRGKELFLKGHRATTFVEQVERQAASLRAALSVEHVECVICVVGGQFGLFGPKSIAGVTLTSHTDLLARIRALPPAIDVAEVDRLGRRIETTLAPATGPWAARPGRDKGSMTNRDGEGKTTPMSGSAGADPPSDQAV